MTTVIQAYLAIGAWLTCSFEQVSLETVQSTCAMATRSSDAYASPSSFHVGACADKQRERLLPVLGFAQARKLQDMVQLI